MSKQGGANPTSSQHRAFGRLEVVRPADATGGALVEFRATYPAQQAPPPPHYHPAQEEHFKVLAGRLTAFVGGKSLVFKQSDEFDVAAGTVHKMWNEGDVEAVLSWEIRPALRSQEFLTAMWASRTSLDQLLLIRKYRSEYRLAQPPVLLQDILFVLLAPFARRSR